MTVVCSILTLLEDQFEWETLTTPKEHFDDIDELIAEYIEIKSGNKFPLEECEDGGDDWVDIIDVD